MKHRQSMVRVNLYLTAPQVSQLQAMSQTLGLSLAEVIRRIIDAYLEAQQSQA